MSALNFNLKQISESKILASAISVIFSSADSHHRAQKQS